MSRHISFAFGAIAGALCTCANFVPHGAPAVGMFLAGIAVTSATLWSITFSKEP